MARARLSSKGQLVVPRAIRDAHGWKAGTVFEIEDTGRTIILRPVLEVPRTTLADLAGCVRYKGKAKTLEEMEEAIIRGALEGL